jgi:hypothetical protein
MADEKNDEQESGGLKSLVDELPLDQLKDDLQGVLGALGDKAKDTVMQRLSDATDSLNDMAQGGGVLTKAAGKGAKAAAEGESPVKGALKGGLGGVKDKVKSALPGGGGGGGGGSKPTKSTNIIEEIDIGAPVDVVYNQWTQFQDFSGFMKKVKSVEQEEDEKLTFQAQIFWSHRTWEATILDQVPNERIVWRSKGEKGHVDGAVTFHELAPNMTRVLVVLEYYPQGFMERTGNIWRAQGRRARLELKHFRRHVMTRTLLDQEELEGWRGEIRDSEVVRDHDEVVEEEEREQDEYEDEGGAEEEPEEEYEDEGGEEPEDEYDEEEPEDDEEPEDEEAPEDEYDEEEPEDDEEPEDEGEEEEAPEDEYDDEEPEDEVEDEEAPEDEYDEEEPEDEGEEEEAPEDEGEEEEAPEDEYDDEEPEDEVEDEEPEEKPRRRSSAKKTSSRKRR